MLSLWWELLTRRWSCEGWDITPSTLRTQSSGRTRKLQNGEKQHNPLKVWLERNSSQRRVHVDQPACGRGRAWWGRERGAWPGSPCHQCRSWGNNDVKLREIANSSWLFPLRGDFFHFFVKNHWESLPACQNAFWTQFELYILYMFCSWGDETWLNMAVSGRSSLRMSIFNQLLVIFYWDQI